MAKHSKKWKDKQEKIFATHGKCLMFILDQELLGGKDKHLIEK